MVCGVAMCGEVYVLILFTPTSLAPPLSPSHDFPLEVIKA
jgi:hypothetical protein